MGNLRHQKHIVVLMQLSYVRALIVTSFKVKSRRKKERKKEKTKRHSPYIPES